MRAHGFLALDVEEFVLIPFCALKKGLTEDEDEGEETYEYEK